MTLPPDTELGTYRIERLLGRGGMGEVYLARDAALERRVALKVLPAELAGDDAFRRRFLAESKLAASLDHPHIVPVYEAGERDGRLVLVMRYVEGEDLGALLAREGALPAARAVGLLRGIADALDAAHDRGLVHRDVKPSNILVARTGRGDEHAYLADFGLVKQLGSSVEFTAPGGFLGSVGYVAPEQIEGRPVDGRADTYSLACVLYQTLTGRAPFAGERDVATLWAHLQAERPRPSAYDPSLARFDPVIARGMAVDPGQRHPSAGELLADAAGALGTEAGPVGAGPTPASIEPPRARRPERTPLIAAGATLLVGAVVAAFAILGPPGGSTPSATPAGPASPLPSASDVGSGVAPPTGTRIVFTRERPLVPDDGPCGTGLVDGKLFVLDPDDPSAAPYRLTDRTNLLERSPVWSPDSSTVVFAGGLQIGPPGLFAIPASGGPLQTLGIGVGLDRFGSNRLGVDPGGTHVVHRGDGALWQTPLAGGERTFIGGAKPPADPVEDISDFAVLPDGTLLVIVAPYAGGDAPRLEQWTMTGTREVLGVGVVDFTSLVVGPDGDTVVVRTPDETGVGSLRIGHLSADLSDLAALGSDLTDPGDVAFSPDGTRLAVVAGDLGARQIHAIDLPSGSTTQLTHVDDASACSPAWADTPADLVAARPSPDPEERPFEVGLIDPGLSVFEIVRPRMTLTFPDGWFARRNYVDGWSVANPALQGEVDYGRVSVGYTGPCETEGELIIDQRPEELIRWLQSRTDLEVSAPSPINLGGYSGLMVDVRGKLDAACADSPDFKSWGLFRVAQDYVSLGEDEAVRIVALDVRDDLVPLMMFSTREGLEAGWNEHARPLLDTITFPD